MAVGLVTAIVCAGISREQSAHEIRHPRALAPQQDMGMVGHQCPGIGSPVSFAKLPIRETNPLFLPMLPIVTCRHPYRNRHRRQSPCDKKSKFAMDKRLSNEYVRIRGKQMLDMLRLKAQPGAVIGKKRL